MDYLPSPDQVSEFILMGAFLFGLFELLLLAYGFTNRAFINLIERKHHNLQELYGSVKGDDVWALVTGGTSGIG